MKHEHRIMRAPNGTEKAILVLAAFLAIVGSAQVVHPIEETILHPSDGPYIGHSGTFDHITKGKSRVYGVMCIMLGVGLGVLVFYRGRDGE